MCVTFCHCRRLLYWNHDPCTVDMCPVADESPQPCQTCRHRRDDDICALTNASLPEVGGCCHWNVTLTEELVPVTSGMAAPLAGYFDRVKEVLADVPHHLAGFVVSDPRPETLSSSAETLGTEAQPNGDDWLIPSIYAPLLDELGIDYRREANDALRVDPEQLILVVEEPVADLLDRLDAPYQVSDGLVWVDPDELGLPMVYGHGTEF